MVNYTRVLVTKLNLMIYEVIVSLTNVADLQEGVFAGVLHEACVMTLVTVVGSS